MLAVEHLTVRYREPPGAAALSDVSFELRPGEALGVVGESGSGKSTLARAVLGLIRPSAGACLWQGRELRRASGRTRRRLRRDIQIVFQDPVASLDPRQPIGASVAEPYTAHEHDTASGVAERTRALLAEVGLEAQAADRYPHELSQGECQRAALARAMMLSPKLLVCDEPVSSLDVSVQGQILNLLARFRAQGTALIVISHNLAVVRYLCERILVLYAGQVMELASREQIFGAPRHPYTQLLLGAVPLADPKRARQQLAGATSWAVQAPERDGCPFRMRCPHAQPLCRAPLALESVAPDHWVACHRQRELAGGAR
jgi:oligopeptide transport system ATP-binding protein